MSQKSMHVLHVSTGSAIYSFNMNIRVMANFNGESSTISYSIDRKKCFSRTIDRKKYFFLCYRQKKHFSCIDRKKYFSCAIDRNSKYFSCAIDRKKINLEVGGALSRVCLLSSFVTPRLPIESDRAACSSGRTCGASVPRAFLCSNPMNRWRCPFRVPASRAPAFHVPD